MKLKRFTLPRSVILAGSFVLLLVGGTILSPLYSQTSGNNPMIKMSTTLGAIEIELYPKEAPVSVKNFIDYVESGHFDGLIFHRIIPGFMIQGGGFTEDMQPRTTSAPIKNEADNGLKNLAGTLSLARTSAPDSATSQFFINLVDNAFLDHTAKTQSGWGYAVFGKVTKGMDVVEKIGALPTTTVGPYGDVPIEAVIIKKAKKIK